MSNTRELSDAPPLKAPAAPKILKNMPVEEPGLPDFLPAHFAEPPRGRSASMPARGGRFNKVQEDWNPMQAMFDQLGVPEQDR